MFSFLFFKDKSPTWSPNVNHKFLQLNFFIIVIGFLPITLSQTLNAKVAKKNLILKMFSIPLQYQNFTSSSNPFFHNHVSLLLSLTNLVRFNIITYLVNFELFSK